jgi:hypothetical protein
MRHPRFNFRDNNCRRNKAFRLFHPASEAIAEKDDGRRDQKRGEVRKIKCRICFHHELVLPQSGGMEVEYVRTFNRRSGIYRKSHGCGADGAG